MSPSRLALGIAAIGLAAAVACLNDSPSQPMQPEVQLALRARVGGTLQGRRVEIRVSYQRTDETTQPLRVTPSSLELGSTESSTSAQISVELGPCLEDELARIGGEPGCLLTVELRLLDAAGILLDVQTQSPASPVLPEDSVELPELTLAAPLLTVSGGGEGTGSGTVTVAEAGGQPTLTCSITNGAASPTGCSQSYPHGTLVILTPTEGQFSGWDLACSGSGACQVEMDRAQEVRAIFAGPSLLGDMNVSITGLPGAVEADVSVTGRGGFQRQLPTSELLSGLEPGDYSVTAATVTSGGVVYTPTPTSQTVTVTAGEQIPVAVAYNAPTTGSLGVIITGLPSGATAAVTVTGPGNFNQPVPTSATLNPLEPGSYTITAAEVSVGGQAYTPAPASQQATVTAGQTTQAGVAYSPPPVTQLAFLQEPSNNVAGASIAPPVRVAARDAQGRTVTTYATAITLGLGTNPVGGALTGGESVTPVAGVATFSALSLNRPGAGYSLVATSGSLPARTSRGFDVTPSPTLSTIVTSSSVIRAASATSVIAVTVRDAVGNPLVGLTVSLSANPTTGNTLVQPTSQTDAAGQASGTLASTGLGTKTISATVNGVPLGPTTSLQVVPGILLVGGDFSPVIAVNPDGSAFDTLRIAENATHPRWSPNRSRVVVTGGSEGTTLTIATATSDSIASVVTDELADHARYSLNGAHLAFRCRDLNADGRLDDVCVIPDVSGPIVSLQQRGNGSGKRFLSASLNPGATIRGFAWDPVDRDRLVIAVDSVIGFTTVSGLYSIRFDGTGLSTISGLLTTVDRDSLLVQQLDWAPSGEYLALQALSRISGNSRIYRINRDGSTLIQLTNPSGSTEDFDPVISPDNRSILFLRSGFGFESSFADYFVVDAGSGGERQVSDEVAIGGNPDELTHDWSPDGSEIVLVGNVGSVLGLYVVPATTTTDNYFNVRRQLSPSSANHAQPSWRP